jgi:hypothetical protein
MLRGLYMASWFMQGDSKHLPRIKSGYYFIMTEPNIINGRFF